jgi:hypothetical protein
MIDYPKKPGYNDKEDNYSPDFKVEKIGVEKVRVIGTYSVGNRRVCIFVQPVSRLRKTDVPLVSNVLVGKNDVTV